MAITVFEKVREILAEDSATDPAIITPESLLEGGDIYASLDMVEGIMACEEYFGIEINDDDIRQMENTVGDLARVVEMKLRAQPFCQVISKICLFNLLCYLKIKSP